jgi:hypothetical protein
MGPFALPLIGAGLGILGGIFGRGKEDPRVKAQDDYLKRVRGMGAPQTAGVDPLSQQAFGLYQNLATQGPNISQFYNPYESQVLEGMGRDTAAARTDALARSADAGARSGVFGGSRAGIMGATALSGINRASLGNMANFRYQGYSDAVRNAQAQQQFGLQSANALAGAGDYTRSVTQAGYDAPWDRLRQEGEIMAGQPILQRRPGLLQSAIGGGIAGFGLGGGLPGMQRNTGTAMPSFGSTPSRLTNWLSGPVPNFGTPWRP